MKDLLQKGFKITLLLCLFLITTLSVMAGTMTSHTYRLEDSTEYMDKTYVFSLRDQQIDTEIKAFCAEYAAPTFDAKRGLIDWIDYNVYELEAIFDYNTAGRIRAIMSTAGPQIEAQLVINYFEDRLGIMNVSYEDVVSAVQYAIWYYTDDLMIVPSSENGYDIYKHLISLPPTSSIQPTDIIRFTPIQIVENPSSTAVTMVYQYDTSGYNAEVGHRYNVDLTSHFNASEEVTKTDNGLRTVTLTFPISNEEINIDFEVIIEGSRRLSSDIYSFTPEDRGTLQSMVGFTRLNESIGLDQKSHNFRYIKHQLTIENDGNIVNESFVSDTQVGRSEIENLNPSGKIQHTFDGWYYRDGSKISDEGVYMDGPKYIIAKYSPITDNGNQSGGGSNPDGGDPTGGTDNPDGGDPTGGTDNPDGGDPNGVTDPPDGQPDTDIIADDTIPEGGIDKPFIIDPEDPVKGLEDIEVIDDPDIPLVSPEIMQPPYGPDGFEGDGKVFYYINRFVESGGVPFIVFFLLGVLALGLGMYLTSQQEKNEQQLAASVGPGGVSGSLASKSVESNSFHENPFHEE